jgi:multimeric flavodoxin WrbA
MTKGIFVLGINGSAKKNGNTAKLLKKVLDHAKKEGAKTEVLHLIDKDIKPCRSYCAKNGTDCQYPCSIKDDMLEVIEKIKASDCIVLASPNYWYSMSGLMKNFIDRLASADMNPSILNGKVAGCIATSDYDGSMSAISQMSTALNAMGAIIAPFNNLFSNSGRGVKTQFGEKDKRLARNLVKLAKLTKNEHGTWV